jgi:hypothetical protein
VSLEDITWDDVVAMPGKFVVATGHYNEGICWMIRRGGASLCGYVGVRAGARTDDLLQLDEPDVDVHGGFNFGPTEGEDEDGFPKGWVWWGWDYGHYGDRFAVPARLTESGRTLFTAEGTAWTPAMVRDEILKMLPAFDVWLRKISGPSYGSIS